MPICRAYPISVSSLFSGDESVQDVVCYSVRLRLGWHPASVHAGQSFHVPRVSRAQRDAVDRIFSPQRVIRF